MFDLKAFIVREIEAAGGRHDEPEIYDGPPGDPGIGGGPGSISWEINGDLGEPRRRRHRRRSSWRCCILR